MRLDELSELERPYFDDYPEFEPYGSPRELLELGVFGGTYFRYMPSEIPASWSVTQSNYFGVHASKPKQWWIDRNLMTPEDPLGWFQWYLNFYGGRRIPADSWQIRRQRSFNARHGAAVYKNGGGYLKFRLKQRQSLLHWACNPAPDAITF